MTYDIKRSISLYSYQDEYYDGKLDLEGCLRETAKTGATGVELLAEQMIKNSRIRSKMKLFARTGLQNLTNMDWFLPATMHFWKTVFIPIVPYLWVSRSI